MVPFYYYSRSHYTLASINDSSPHSLHPSIPPSLSPSPPPPPPPFSFVAQAPPHEIDNFWEELQLMKTMAPHANTVNLLGYCTTQGMYKLTVDH